MTAKEIRSEVTVGSMWRVTNHYIERRDHHCYGTRLAMVTAVTGSSFTLGDRGLVKWPNAAQISKDPDGSILLYGGGAAQTPEDLWLTLQAV